MNFNKILFLGLGGAGQRHLRILKDLYPEAKLMTFRSTSKTPLLNPDFTVNENDSVDRFYQLETYSSSDEAFSHSPDLTVISTPTSTHMELAIKALECGSHLLVEKPFSSNLEHFELLENLAKKNNLRILTSFQRRENPHFQKIKSMVSDNLFGTISNVIFNISSYVPAWHKYEDFKQLYACNKKLGGGALLTEIHEIDLCYWFFGLPEAVSCTGGNFSEFTLDIEDTANLVLLYANFNVHLNISFFQKENYRKMDLHGSQKSLHWSEDKNELTLIDHLDNSKSSDQLDFDMNMMFEAQAKSILTLDPNFQQEDILKAKASIQIVELAKSSMKEKKVLFFKEGHS